MAKPITEQSEQAGRAEAPSTEQEKKSLSDMRKIIDTMVPPKTVEVVDVVGNEYRLPGAVSARVQVEILRVVEGLSSLPAGALFGGSVGDTKGLVAMLSILAREPLVLTALAEAFGLAHPAALAKALAAVRAEGIEANDAADAFAVEEIVAALVPLFVRLAKRGASAADAVAAREA
jgi:hypothetical protein